VTNFDKIIFSTLSLYIEYVITGKRHVLVCPSFLYSVFVYLRRAISFFYWYRATNVKINNSVSGRFRKMMLWLERDKRWNIYSESG